MQQPGILFRLLVLSDLLGVRKPYFGLLCENSILQKKGFLFILRCDEGTDSIYSNIENGVLIIV